MRIATVRHALGVALWLAAVSPAFATTLFLEDFQTDLDPVSGQPKLRCSGPGGAGTYTFPAGWFLRNVDNRTPDAQTAYVNDAWEVRENFIDGAPGTSECVAFSTSYYSPVGDANDFMWTPAIGPIPVVTTQLTWRARAYDPNFRDGYEVRIMTTTPTGGTGVIGNQLTNSTVVFSTAAETAGWSSHTVDLAPYAGQTIYIGFRNNSNDKFLLVVDDVKVQTVAAFDPRLLQVAQTPAHGYSKLPAPLEYSFALEARVDNAGTSTISDVTVAADLLAGGQPADALTSTPIPTLAPGATQTVPLGNFTYDQIGQWTVEAMVSSAQGDDDPGNSVIEATLTDVTADQLARARGEPTGTLGIGAGTGGELGIDFTLPRTAHLDAVRATIVNTDAFPQGPTPEESGDGVGDFNGYTLSLLVRSWNIADDEPGALLATGTTSVAPDAMQGVLDLEFEFDGLQLPPGRYLLSIVEPTTPAPVTMSLHTTQQGYTPGTGWVIWPGSPFGGWGNLEQFGANFQVTFNITAVLRLPILVPVAVADVFAVPASGQFAGDVSANDTPSDDGGNVWSVISPPASGLFSMQPDGSFAYTPAPGDAGTTVTFDYSVCDVDDDCSTATVDLQVRIDTPVAVDDAFDVPSTGDFNGDVSPNDTPSDDGGNTWSVAVPPASGTLVFQPDGSFVYGPAAGTAGDAVTFEYSLCDADTDCSTATATLNIEINTPVAVDDLFQVPSDGPFTGDVSLNDTPSDDGGNVWSVVSPPATGLLTLQPGGGFTFTAEPSTAGTTVTFTYSVCDADTDCDQATVQLQVGYSQPIAVDDAFEIFPAGPFTGSVAANDTASTDGGNVWSVTTPPASGTLSMQADGAFTYTPAAGAMGTSVTFGYSLCDVDDDCDQATVELTVSPFLIFGDSFEGLD